MGPVQPAGVNANEESKGRWSRAAARFWNPSATVPSRTRGVWKVGAWRGTARAGVLRTEVRRRGYPRAAARSHQDYFKYCASQSNTVSFQSTLFWGFSTQ